MVSLTTSPPGFTQTNTNGTFWYLNQTPGICAIDVMCLEAEDQQVLEKAHAS